MPRWLRRALLLILVLLLVLGVLLAIGLLRAQQRMERKLEIPAYGLTLPTGAEALARGRYLYQTRGCVDCHGAAGNGRTLVDQDGLKIAGSKIGPGPGSVTAGYQASDWERAIRHGVAPGGRPLLIMPSEDYNRLTDVDLGALVAYVLTLPPEPGGAAVLQLHLPFRVMYGWGLIPDAASRIDHRLPPEQPVPEGVSLAHGRYVAQMCLGCHGAQLAGGRIPGAPPDWPPAARLSPGEGSVMPRYATADSFVAMMRSGLGADGRKISVMPFESLRGMSDTDLRAMHLYLQSLPAR
jgi:mono/diheme cytochrome c family protein